MVPSCLHEIHELNFFLFRVSNLSVLNNIFLFMYPWPLLTEPRVGMLSAVWQVNGPSSGVSPDRGRSTGEDRGLCGAGSLSPLLSSPLLRLCCAAGTVAGLRLSPSRVYFYTHTHCAAARPALSAGVATDGVPLCPGVQPAGVPPPPPRRPPSRKTGAARTAR